MDENLPNHAKDLTATRIPQKPGPKQRELENAIRFLIWRHDSSVEIRFQRTVPRGGVHGKHQYTWDGRTLISAGQTYESYLHDVAHWLVATPEQREIPEFGLGADPYRDSDAPLVMSHEAATRIESRTCDVQLLLAVALDLSPRAVETEVGVSLPSDDVIGDLYMQYPRLLPRQGWRHAKRALAIARYHGAQAMLRDRIYGIKGEIRDTEKELVRETQRLNLEVKQLRADLQSREAELDMLIKNPPRLGAFR